MGLFSYPQGALFDRPISKTVIYDHAHIPNRVRKLFTSQVSKIIWRYKLAPETINIRDSDTIAEVQIFSIILKDRDLSESVLHAIDKAIPHPIIFELEHENRCRAVACYKRPSEAGGDSWVPGDYFFGDWKPEDAKRLDFPVATNMAELYDSLLSPLIPKGKGSVRDRLERAEAIKALESEIIRLRSALKEETQFKHKMTLNDKIKQLQRRIDKLKS